MNCWDAGRHANKSYCEMNSIIGVLFISVFKKKLNYLGEGGGRSEIAIVIHPSYADTTKCTF